MYSLDRLNIFSCSSSKCSDVRLLEYGVITVTGHLETFEKGCLTYFVNILNGKHCEYKTHKAMRVVLFTAVYHNGLNLFYLIKNVLSPKKGVTNSIHCPQTFTIRAIPHSIDVLYHQGPKMSKHDIFHSFIINKMRLIFCVKPPTFQTSN